MSNAKRSFSPYNGQPNQRRSQQPYFMDKSLVPRVKEFLTNYADQSKADVDVVIQHLVANFPEYARKKRAALRQSVFKVLQYVFNDELQRSGKSPGIDQRSKTNNQSVDADEKSHASSSDEQEELVEAKDTNMINNSMHQIYARAAKGAFSTPGFMDSPRSERYEGQSTPSLLKINDSAAADLTNSSMADEVPNLPNLQKHKISLKDRISDASTPIPSPSASKSGKSDDEKSKQNQSQIKRRRKNEQEKPAGSKQPIKQTESDVKLADVGGYENCLEEVIKLLFHLKHPEVFQRLGVKPPRGFLLHGPPGCGKTLLANAIAGELQLPYFRLAATEVISGVSGESEENLRELFTTAQASAPSIIFLDEIDAIAPNRETASKEMERRIVSQLLVCMDDLNQGDADVLIIGATNRPDSLDPALRRAGRFDREICLGIPDRAARVRILKVVCTGLRLSEDLQFDEIASLTPGFVGADLVSLTREAAMFAVQRIFTQLEKNAQLAISAMEGVEEEGKSQDEAKSQDGAVTQDKAIITSDLKLGAFSWLRDQPPLHAQELELLFIEKDDFKNALATVQPSAKREGFATVPDVSWQDIGALENIRDELSLAVLAPVRHYKQFASLGISSPPGILLAGPPGCGKTLLAKAIANEAGINFISVKGPELLNMYVGESEKAVRQVFQRARNSAPCVIFFDEIDALCPRRSDMAESSASSRVVNQLLTEMDGLEARKQVFLMGATNRPDIIDSAVLRPGRLDKILFVGLPSPEDRVKILQTITKFGARPKLSSDVNLESIGTDTRCERFSGADLAALVREASVQRLKDLLKEGNLDQDLGQDIEVMALHFEQAFEKLRPSVSVEDTIWYTKMEKKFGTKASS